MIQRIQTIYLLLAIIFILIAFFYIPIFDCLDSLNNIYVLNNIFSFLFLCMLSLLTIFSFKHRRRQIKLIYLLSFLVSAIVLLRFFLVYDVLSSNLLVNCDFNILTLPLLVFGKMFFYLAIKSIRKDEELLDSINRLR